jgi:hemolysin activation/secretion protein
MGIMLHRTKRPDAIASRFVLSVVALAVAGMAADPAAAQATRAPDTFTIAAIDVVGVTKLPAQDIEKIIYTYTGPNKSGADVEAARKAIQDAYAARGYEAVVVEIPTQSTALFAQGVVEIKVSEAPVGRIEVVDAKHHSASGVRADVPSLKEGQPLDLKALQTDLAAANRFPDRTITPSFKAGAEPGTVDVALKVEDSLPLHASVELNNDNSPSTTDLRASGTIRYTNLWGAGHSISATYAVSPKNQHESKVYSGSYTAPLIGTPWTLLLYGYKSNSNIAALGGTNVLGNGYQIGGRAILRLPSQKTSQSISFGADFKDFKQNVFVGGVKAGSAPIRYLPLVAEYSIGGGGEHSSFDFTIGATAGLRTIKKVKLDCITTTSGTFCDPVDQFSDKAVDSIENFVHLNLSGDYRYATKHDFIAKLGMSAQLSDVHLAANEQFGIGGMSNVRGYFQSEAVGDSGVTGSLEIQSPSFATLFGSYVDELRVYGFVDGGYTWVLGRIPQEQDSKFTLVSVGGGARVKLFGHLSGEVLAGVPLTTGPVSKKGDPRVTFQVKSEF